MTSPPVGSSTGTCAPSQTIDVRSSQVIVFSSSNANITVSPVVLQSCTAGGAGAPLLFTVTVLDVNGNAMPAGTAVSFTSTNGTITSSLSYVVPDTDGCLTSASGCPALVGARSGGATFGDIPVIMKSDAAWAAGVCTDATGHNGNFTVTVTTPLGVITSATTTVAD